MQETQPRPAPPCQAVEWLSSTNQQRTSAGEDAEKKEPSCTADPLLGIYPKKPETPIRKDICTPMFIAAQFTRAKIWKQPKWPSADEWIKKWWYIYTMEYYAAVKKKEFLPFTTAWMELESIMLCEISQSEKDKHHMISLIYGI
uniref:DUF1725 domain-containing protein n=1 Tax=Pipistrellus kuhlii TaxID=59472 RepID=A0A7J7ZKK5_PIPKU|nr:hypothetical protein mPipKuh1_009474 [Pipistrellus kuhlii]